MGVAAVVGAAVMLVACSERARSDDDEPVRTATATTASPSATGVPTDAPDGPGPGPYDGDELARLIQAAIDREGAYTLAVRQENLVLPRWGGSDGGTVTIGLDEGQAVAVANLRRTGDGDYTIWLREGQTYFKRSTCNALARVPGGTDEVLQPFNFLGKDRLEEARNLRAATGRTVLMLEMEDWGPVEIGVEPRTFRPTTVSALNATKNGKPLLWEFKDWGKQPEIELSDTEFEKAYDRGPGGNPC
jgi:hypothetical protein